MRGKDTCRNCHELLPLPCLSLGNQPLPNAVVTSQEQSLGIIKHPLELRICEYCSLGQVGDSFGREEIFNSDYTYQSGISKSWREQSYKRALKLTEELNLKDNARVLEIASNDGSALLPFVEMGFKTYGVEPASNLAELSKTLGIARVYDEFFGEKFARKYKPELGEIDLVIANNVAAHVPDIHDFFAGVAKVMSKNTVLSVENPGLDSLIDNLLVDTIYHEHYSYLSATSMLKILETHGLWLFDVEKISLHGGSLRYLIKKDRNHKRENAGRLRNQLVEEEELGIKDRVKIQEFYVRALKALDVARDFFTSHSADGIVGVGAAAKATVMLNSLEVDSHLATVFDSNPRKHGNFIPGTSVKILPFSDLEKFNFAHLVIFPWNLTEEFVQWARGNIPKSVKMWKLLPEVMEVR